MADQVLIEFISDVSKLKPATDQLEQQGKVTKQNNEEFKKTNAELLKQQKALEQIGAINKQIEQSGKVTRKNLADLASVIKKQSGDFQKEIQRGVVDALHEAGVSVEEFSDALEGAVSPTIKQRLKELVTELAEMKAAGQDNTEQYRLLAQEAGHLKDAIGDANQEVKNFGSDTSTIDGVISLASGLAGGFAVAQGAVALFGDESEELQKTLLKVNAAMAILQGLQQVQSVLQKESAAATLLQTIATKGQTAAQVVYNFVVGESIGVMKAFKIALALTGVGAFIIVVYELVQALKSSKDIFEQVNKFIEEQNRLLEDNRKAIQDNGEIRVAAADAAGKAESELSRIREANFLREKGLIIQSNKALTDQQKYLKSLPGFIKNMDETTKAWNALNDQIKDNNKALKDINQSLALEAIRGEKALAEEKKKALEDAEDARKKAADDAKKAAEEVARKAKERRAAEFADFKAGIELQLLAAKEGSEEQLDLRKQLLRSQLQIDLDNEKLTLNQRKLLIQQFFKGRLDAEKGFVANRSKVLLENVASDLNAELQSLELSNGRRLELTESIINLQAEMEITAAENNAAKIAEINARRDKAIRDARITSIQEAANYNIQVATAINGPEQRRLAKVIENTKEELAVRINAVDIATALTLKGVQTRIQALNDEKQQGLISIKEYNLQYSQLVDEQAKIIEDAETKKQNLIAETTEQARQQAIELTQTILDATSQVIGVLDSLFQLQAAKENDALDRRKKQLDELKEAGAITEKEAISRQKRLEADERRIRQQQAKREKTIAVFNAAIAVPQAVLKGLISGGPILAAIYGAIAAAQLILVASRPVPKFGKGKKDKYQGLGQVGETGTEIIQSGGKMYVADKPQIVWLGKDDKVFNPQETIDMLSHGSVNTERIVIPAAKNGGMKIDYDKFGRSVAKHVSTNVYVDGIQEQAKRQQEFTHYLTKRRAW